MVETGVALFTVGVFHDLAWAQKGVDALIHAGFPVESLTVLSKDSPDAGAFIQRVLGAPAERIDLAGVGVAAARGSLLPVLQGEGGHDLAKLGLAGTMRRVGFQAHDGRIFDALTARGGVLVAIQGDPRAADALAVLHSYGGGNAAIGAWAGRV
jgi:hypothetical protein